MKSKKETEPKSGAKKAAPATLGSPVPSVLQIAPAKPAVATSEPKAPRPAKPIKVTPPIARLKSKAITSVQARIDVGYGNALYIRGQGDGLSWDKGAPLVCADSASWVWSTEKADGKIEFKLLLNDEIWAQGENLVVTPGETIETTPTFN